MNNKKSKMKEPNKNETISASESICLPKSPDVPNFLATLPSHTSTNVAIKIKIQAISI